MVSISFNAIVLPPVLWPNSVTLNTPYADFACDVGFAFPDCPLALSVPSLNKTEAQMVRTEMGTVKRDRGGRHHKGKLGKHSVGVTDELRPVMSPYFKQQIQKQGQQWA